jgi:hypothetical protein
VQVMSLREGASHVWVRWPGGKVAEAEIPAGAREVEMGLDGTMRKVK